MNAGSARIALRTFATRRPAQKGGALRFQTRPNWRSLPRLHPFADQLQDLGRFLGALACEHADVDPSATDGAGFAPKALFPIMPRWGSAQGCQQRAVRDAVC